MAREFDANRLDIITVSKREDGKLVVLDGQHRIAAARLIGWDRPVWCNVLEGLTLAQEAARFLMMQEGRKAVRRFDQFTARVVAKDQAAVDIKKTVDGHGLKISKYVARGNVCAVESLEYAYGKGTLNKVLLALCAWDEGDGTLDKRMIRGVSAFFVAYPEASPAVLGRQLNKHRPLKVLKDLRGNEELYGKEVGRVVTFKAIYNKSRNKGRLGAPEAEPVAAE